MLLFSDMLYMLVLYANPSGHMGMMCLLLTLSGPGVLFLLCFIVSVTCVVGSVIVVVCSLCIFLSMCLFVLYVLEVVCMWSVSCPLGCCVCLRGE